ncbi:unnamed protein product [Paramecium sonneborni]|uniref:Uncharacterized protein n=1 Tax=Paramecium sonneborni TaxID=65129 RepID=A0A8S1LGP9_9CILI|nr:unnamed protein product [Paramecium sonneborni]
MQINGRLSSYQFHSEINVEKEAAEIASRIMDRVRQKSNIKSNQQLTNKGDSLRFSEYQSRASEFSSIRHGTNSITDRNEIDLKSTFRQPQSYYSQFSSNTKHIEIVKPLPQFNFQQQSSSEFNDFYQKTIKLNNNYYPPPPQSQSTTDKPESNKLIKLMDTMNNIANGKSESNVKKHRKIDSITHSKSILSIKTTQFSTPLKQNKEEIVSQLLGSLRNSNKYSEYANSGQK